MVFRLPSESLLATPRPSRPSRVRFETRDVRVARSSTGVRCTCGLRSRWCAAPQRMPRLVKYPPAQVKLIVYASAREFGANTVSDMARFPANTSVLYRRKATSREPRTRPTGDTGDLFRERLGRNLLQAPTRIFSAFASFSSGRHLGCPRGQTALPTVARCTVAMWTDGRSARPLTWARRTQVRVFARTQPHATPYASTPRLPESAPSAPLTRGHSPAATPVPTLTSPLRAQTKAARSGASCAPDARAKGAARCWCTRRYARGRTRAFAKRVTKTRDDEVFSTTALTTFSSPSRRRAVASPSRRRRL